MQAAPTRGDEAQPSIFAFRDWSFEASQRPLWGSERVEATVKELSLCAAPDMLFGDSLLRFVHGPTKTCIELTAFSALTGCSWSPPSLPHSQPPHEDDSKSDGPLFSTVKCQYAKRWTPATGNPDVKVLNVTSDWTFSTGYWGGIRCGDENLVGEEALASLPWDLLRQRDEIHWYNEVRLWEDELDDNGVSRLIARVRVMPSFWLVLLQCEVRVDNVIIREIATRLFHKFDSDHILREWTWREASYEELKARGVNFAENPNITGENVGTALLTEHDVKRQVRHRIRLGSGCPGSS